MKVKKGALRTLIFLSLQFRHPYLDLRAGFIARASFLVSACMAGVA